MAEKRTQERFRGDRRQRQDAMSVAVPWVLIVCWVLIWAAWMFIYKAPPGSPLYVEYQMHEYWYGVNPMRAVMFILNALFVISTTGFFISFKRRRRRGEHPSIVMIIMLLMSLVGIVYMYLRL